MHKVGDKTYNGGTMKKLSDKQVQAFKREVDAIRANKLKEQGKPKLRLATVDGRKV